MFTINKKYFLLLIVIDIFVPIHMMIVKFGAFVFLSFSFVYLNNLLNPNFV